MTIDELIADAERDYDANTVSDREAYGTRMRQAFELGKQAVLAGVKNCLKNWRVAGGEDTAHAVSHVVGKNEGADCENGGCDCVETYRKAGSPIL